MTMWWIALIVLAVVAFFVVKMMKSQTERQQSEHARLNEVSGLQGTLDQNTGAGAGDTNANQSDNLVAGTSSGTVSAGAAAAGAVGVAAVAGVSSAAHAGLSNAIDTGNAASDVQEMIKILNLAGPDAGRLGLSSEQLLGLRQGDTTSLSDQKALGDVADKLRSMLA